MADIGHRRRSGLREDSGRIIMDRQSATERSSPVRRSIPWPFIAGVAVALLPMAYGAGMLSRVEEAAENVEAKWGFVEQLIDQGPVLIPVSGVGAEERQREAIARTPDGCVFWGAWVNQGQEFWVYVRQEEDQH